MDDSAFELRGRQAGPCSFFRLVLLLGVCAVSRFSPSSLLSTSFAFVMDRTQGGFNTGSLHSPPPTRRNWDDATTDIPLHETGSPHVQFAAKSPSIIPSPVYANSPSMPSGSVVASPATLPPPLPMHTSSTTTDYPSGPSTSARNFGADTFNHNGGEKVAVENEDNNMGYALYERNNNNAAVNNQPTYYGNTGLRSDGFMRLESQEDDMQQTRDASGGGAGAATAYKDGQYAQPMSQQGTSYVPYLQQPAMMDSAGRRNLGMRLLLGPVRRPWFSWISGLAMLIVLVVEFVKNSQMTGSVIETSPTFNPMIGPSYTVSIIQVGDMTGSRYSLFWIGINQHGCTIYTMYATRTQLLSINGNQLLLS